jgi:hypothetical protein
VRDSHSAAGLRVKTRVKAGALAPNHNETQVRDSHSAAGLRVKTRIKAGALAPNHNETQVRDSNLAAGLRVKTRVKAGALAPNHNETQVREGNSAAGRRLRSLGAGLAVAIAILAPAAHAQGTAVLRTTLNCTTSAGTSSFAVSSWSFASSTGQKVPFTMTKAFDECSPALYTMSLGGTMKSIILTVHDSKTNQGALIELGQVTVSSYYLSGSASSPVEAIAFTYGSVSYH